MSDVADRAAPPGVAVRTAAVSGAAVSMAVLLAAVVGLGGVAVRLGADGNYDLRNYHFYIGWALFHKPVGYDVGPAQIQGYNHPLLDGILYLAWRVLNHMPRVFTFVWSIPQAVAVWLAFLVARSLVPGATLLAVAAACIAADGAVSVGVVGTSMSEGIPNALLGAGVLLAVRAPPSAWRMAGAGLLAGLAVGLKLTAAPYLIGFGAATLVSPGFGAPARRARLVLAMVAGATAGLAAIGGPWWWALWRSFGNPLFPFYNALFLSPWYGPWNFIDDRFFPRTAWQWVAYPLEWTLRKSRLVSEEPVRDARIGLALVAALALLAVRALRRPVPAGAVWCAVFTLVSYGLWLKVFSILRYASALEVMSGVVIVAALHALLPRRLPRPARGAAALAVAVLLLATTVYPTWERRRAPGDTLLTVTVPALPPDSLVILLVPTPASYVAAFEPPSVRFVGVHNTLIPLDAQDGLQDRVVALIRDATGPIWGLDKTDAFFGMAEQSLDRYGLRRTDECHPIGSNVDTHLRLCRLERAG